MWPLAVASLCLVYSSYGDTRAALTEGLEVAQNGEAHDAVDLLSQALDGVAKFPVEFAAQEDALALRDTAMLALAFSYFALDETERLHETIEEAIRTARGRELPVQQFGPTFAEIYEQRLRTLAAQGTARIAVQCADCRVLIDEAPAEHTSETLYLGSYRLVVLREDSVLLSDHVTLSEADEFVWVSVPPPPSPPAPDLSEVTPLALQRPDTRVIPLWASASGMVIGAALLIAGGVILSYEGRCPDGHDPVTERNLCPEVFNAQPAGLSLIAGGAAVLTSFAVILGADEQRKGRQALSKVALQYTFRF